MSYDAKEIDNSLTYAGVFLTALGIIELGASFIRVPADVLRSRSLTLC